MNLEILGGTHSAYGRHTQAIRIDSVALSNVHNDPIIFIDELTTRGRPLAIPEGEEGQCHAHHCKTHREQKFRRQYTAVTIFRQKYSG